MQFAIIAAACRGVYVAGWVKLVNGQVADGAVGIVARDEGLVEPIKRNGLTDTDASAKEKS